MSLAQTDVKRRVEIVPECHSCLCLHIFFPSPDSGSRLLPESRPARWSAAGYPRSSSSSSSPRSLSFSSSRSLSFSSSRPRGNSLISCPIDRCVTELSSFFLLICSTLLRILGRWVSPPLLSRELNVESCQSWVLSVRPFLTSCPRYLRGQFERDIRIFHSVLIELLRFFFSNFRIDVRFAQLFTFIKMPNAS